VTQRALVDQVSLRGSAGAVLNADFREGLQDWLPKDPPDITAVDSVLSNTGAFPVELHQAPVVKPGKECSIDFDGDVTLTGTVAPVIEARFLSKLVVQGKEQEKLEGVLRLPLLPNTFPNYRILGAVPEKATALDFCLILPPGARITVRNISFTQPADNTIPITVISEAPGKLQLAKGVFATEPAPPRVPPVPPEGLCAPTPPDKDSPLDPDCAYCCSCGKTQPMAGSQSGTTTGGKPVTMGYCLVCNHALVRHGGPTTVVAPVRLDPRVVVRPFQPVRPLFDVNVAGSAGFDTGIALPLRPAPIPRIFNLTDLDDTLLASIAEMRLTPGERELSQPHLRQPTLRTRTLTPPKGGASLVAISVVGKARKAKLKDAGIRTLDDLLAAGPQKIAGILGIDEKAAGRFINRAKNSGRIDGFIK
jgi:hypothetical protein